MRRNRLEYKKLASVSIFLVFAYLLTAVPASAAGAPVSVMRNGLGVTLYDEKDVASMTARDAEGRLILTLADGTTYELIEDVGDPEIANKGDGSFHPMKSPWVMDALRKIDVGGVSMTLPVNVYVLPMPRRGMLASSSFGSNIILSPGVYEIDRTALECTVTHELGHVFQFRYAPLGEAAWSDFLSIRGLLDATVYSENAARMYRPSEIFADDFRALFGGPEACASGAIENPDLALPADVAGLREYFIALLTRTSVASADGPEALPIALSNYPNPFNPSTTVRVSLGAPAGARAGRVDVSIYRVDGSLVKRLYRGGAEGSELALSWDGRDDGGKSAASGVYLCAVRAGGKTVVHKMLLIR